MRVREKYMFVQAILTLSPLSVSIPSTHQYYVEHMHCIMKFRFEFHSMLSLSLSSSFAGSLSDARISNKSIQFCRTYCCAFAALLFSRRSRVALFCVQYIYIVKPNERNLQQNRNAQFYLQKNRPHQWHFSTQPLQNDNNTIAETNNSEKQRRKWHCTSHSIWKPLWTRRQQGATCSSHTKNKRIAGAAHKIIIRKYYVNQQVSVYSLLLLVKVTFNI